MALGIGYGLPFVAQHGANPYKTQWAAAREGAKGAGATVEDENAGTGSCLVSRGQDVYTDGLPFTPSLLIVPQFYKDGNLYQDVPPFVAEDMTMRFTVSRNTTATRVNSSGLIESVASGVPRIDWLGQSCPGLLVEASGQNVLSYSEEFDNAVWAKSGMTVSTGTTAAFTAPDGTTNADKIIATTASGVAHTIQRSGLASAAYTFSIFAKAGEESVISLWLRGNTVRAEFNLVSGTISNITVTSARIENYGNGWYRCSVYDSTAGTTASVYGRGGGAYTGNGVDGFYLWGAQLEAGSIATTYIPTTTGAVSRAADVISASGALVSGLIGQTEGTIYAEVDVRNFEQSARILAISDGTTSNRITLLFNTSSRFRLLANVSASGQVDLSSIAQVAGIHKIAVAYKENDYAFYLNGSQVATDTSALVPACSSVFLGKIESSASTNFLNDRIRAAALYTTRLTDAQLAELTRL